MKKQYRTHEEYKEIVSKVLDWQLPRTYPGKPDAPIHPEDWAAFASTTLEVVCLTLSAIDGLNEK